MVSSKLVRSVGMALGLYAATLSVASADEAMGWYFGASGGQSQMDIDQDELDVLVVDAMDAGGAVVLSGSSTLDDSDTTWSVFGGYRFSPYCGIEAGYQNLGVAKYRSSGEVAIPGFPGVFDANVDIDFESSGFTAAALGAIPLGDNFDLHGRLGLYFSEVEASIDVAIEGEGQGQSESVDSQSVFYGVGAAAHFAGNWSISLDYLLFKEVGDEEEIGEADIDAVTLSVSYRL